MRVCVPKEIKSGEKRVALVPDIISKLIKAGLEVVIESGAGVASEYSDKQFTDAGAQVKSGDVLANSDVVLSVQPLTPAQVKSLKKGAITISFLSPTTATDSIDAAVAAGVTALSLEMVPRISRAQSMDALTSQALCAGYKASLVAAELSPKFFPLLMTAAGTVTPAKVVVLGAGVAGLQAIATAKRLGAVVSAYDVRPASADEVKSMGAKFITLELEALEGAGGYAREMTEERAAKQRTAQMVSHMAPGSVVVDLAAESGGNVEGSVAGEITTTSGGVKIWGGKDVPSQLAFHASMLFSRNVVNLLLLMSKTADGKPTGVIEPDFSDEIIDSATLTHAGSKREKGK